VVPCSHARELYDIIQKGGGRCHEPWWAEDYGHNDMPMSQVREPRHARRDPRDGGFKD
jgi:hypothetical protein